MQRPARFVPFCRRDRAIETSAHLTRHKTAAIVANETNAETCNRELPDGRAGEDGTDVHGHPNAAGLLLLAYGHLIGADVRPNGGPATVILGVAFLILCLRGMRALLHPRSN